jgi:hypothetical protein
MILHKRLNTEKDFEQLKPGDIVAVEFQRNMHGGMPEEYQRFNVFHIAFVKLHDHEVILKVEGNIYFNYKMYLEGTSVCKNAELITVDDEYKIKEEEE